MPMLVATGKAYASREVDFIGVSLDQGGVTVLQPFIQQYQIDFPVVLPGEGPSLADGLSAIPVTVLIDRAGRVAQAYRGSVSESQLKPDLIRWSAKSPALIRRSGTHSAKPWRMFAQSRAGSVREPKSPRMRRGSFSDGE